MCNFSSSSLASFLWRARKRHIKEYSLNEFNAFFEEAEIIMEEEDKEHEEEEEEETTMGKSTRTNINSNNTKMGNCRMCEEEETTTTVGEGKYRCPKCLLISCSLKCINKHKEKFNCDGKRDRFQFVNLKEMEDKHVTSDFRFLEEATEVLDRAKRKRTLISGKNKNGQSNNNNNNNNKRKRNSNNKKRKNNKTNNNNVESEATRVVVGVAPEAPAPEAPGVK